MATFVERDRAVNLLKKQYDAAATLAADVDEAQWELDTCLPGWTVRDQFTHMIGVERMLLGEETPTVEIDVSSLDHVRNDFGQLVETWVESMRDWSGDQMRSRWDDVRAARVDALNDQTQEDFETLTITPAGKDSTGRFMRIRLFDLFLHENDMRDALGLPLRDDPEQLAFALEEPASVLPFVAGKLAGLPSGTRLAVELTGTVPQTLLIEVVDGRAQSVESLAGEPTFTVTMDSHLFLRLCGGRLEGGPLIGDRITVTGDDALGRQLIENLAYTP